MYQNQTRSLHLSIVVFLLLTAAPVSAQTSESLSSNNAAPITLKKNIRDNNVYDQKKITLGTIDELKRELLSAPDDAMIYNNLGAAYALLKNYDEAVPALEKAIALKPDFFNALYNLSIVYDHLERFSDALTAIQKAIALDAGNVAARTEMCQLYLVTKKFREAAPCYEILIKMKTPDKRTRASYGIALTQSKQYAKALVVLKENAELFPNEAMTHNALGMLMFTKKKYKQARDCFNRALEINANYEPARYNLAITQALTNDRASALKQYALLKKSNSVFADPLYRFLYRDKIVYANK